jgi:hypothetical protein
VKQKSLLLMSSKQGGDQNYWAWNKNHEKPNPIKKPNISVSAMDVDSIQSPQQGTTILDQISKATLVTPVTNLQIHQLDKKKAIFRAKINTMFVPDGSRIDLMSLDSPRGADGFHTLSNAQASFHPTPKFESVIVVLIRLPNDYRNIFYRPTLLVIQIIVINLLIILGEY